MSFFPQKTYCVSNKNALAVIHEFDEEVKIHGSKNLMYFNSFYPDCRVISDGVITHIVFSVKKATKCIFAIINIFLLLIQILIFSMCGKNILPTYLLPMLLSLITYVLLRCGFAYQVKKLLKAIEMKV